MSQSGIPIISDVAKVAVNTANSVSGIAKGENVFKSLGQIGGSISGLPAATVRSQSFGLSDKIPLIGDQAKSASNVLNDPNSSNLLGYAKQTGISSVTVAGAGVGAAYGGLGAGVGAKAGSSLAKGDFSGALSAASPALSGLVPNDLKGLYDQYGNEIKGLAAGLGRPSPVNNINPASQVLTDARGNVSGLGIVILSVGGLGLYFLLRKK